MAQTTPPNDTPPAKTKAQKVDPSVSEYDQYLTGEPRGSVPMSVTIGKPAAYYPPTKGPK
jgi:hypothetical protein